MLRCVRCDTENPDSAQYCDECGSRLNDRDGTATGIFPSGRLTMTDDESKFDETQFTPSNRQQNEPPDSLAGWLAAGGHNQNVSSIGQQIGSNATQINQTDTRIGQQESGFAHARLVIERGKNAGKEFVLSENEMNIGRWDADNGIFPDVDLDADDPEAKVSRRHARIVRYGNQYLIEDLGSTNGTFVNRGRRLLPGNRQVIQDGDEIIVGKTFLRFQIIR